MNSGKLNEFQHSVSEVLVRHKSILDVITKYQESGAKVNRAIIKAVTNCGCIQIDAEKQHIPDDISYEDMNKFLSSHVSGKLCDICKDKLEEEIGNHMFYLTALCHTLSLDLENIIKKQWKHIHTLGKYSLY